MTRLIRLCILFSIVLASICIWLGFWILSLQDELADLQKMTTVLAVPPLRTVDMTLKQHIIQLSDSGTSVVCRCFDVLVSPEDQLLSAKPEISGSSLQVVKSLSLYSTSVDSAGCSAGANFECSDYFGGLQSQLLMRWDLVQHQRRIREDESDFDQSNPLKTKADDRPISMPQGLSLRAIPRGSEVDGRGAVKKHRLMLAGWYELMENPALMNPALWSARQPWAKLGMTVQIANSPPSPSPANATLAVGGGQGAMLSLASVGFVVPSGSLSFTHNFTVGVSEHSGWLSQTGQKNGFTIFGALLTTRRVGVSATVRVLRPAAANTTALIVVGEFGVTAPPAALTADGGMPGNGQQGLLLDGQPGQLALPGGRLEVQAEDVIEVVCRYNSAARVADVRAAWVSSAAEPTEICAAELMVYPAIAIARGRHTLLPQQCTITG